MPYSELFWTKFLEVFPPVIGAVLGLMPVLLLTLGTIGLALRLYHQRTMARIESARQALGLEPDSSTTTYERTRARTFLQSGF